MRKELEHRVQLKQEHLRIAQLKRTLSMMEKEIEDSNISSGEAAQSIPAPAPSNNTVNSGRVQEPVTTSQTAQSPQAPSHHDTANPGRVQEPVTTPQTAPVQTPDNHDTANSGQVRKPVTSSQTAQPSQAPSNHDATNSNQVRKPVTSPQNVRGNQDTTNSDKVREPVSSSQTALGNHAITKSGQVQEPASGSQTALGNHTVTSSPRVQEPVSSSQTAPVQGKKRPRAPSIEPTKPDPAAGKNAKEANLPQLATGGLRNSTPVTPVTPVKQETPSPAEISRIRTPGEPPRPLTRRYHGTSISDYHWWRRSMEIGFKQYPDSFPNDRIKLRAGFECISQRLQQQFMSHIHHDPRDETWEGFCTFLLRRFGSFDSIEREAHQKYSDARQRPGQTVRDFSSYLVSLESFFFTGRISEKARMEGLRARVLPEIRNEVFCFNRTCATYAEMVDHLYEVEMNIPSRREILLGGSPESGPPSKRSSNGAASSKRDARKDSSTEGKRSQNIPFCNCCTEYGHIVAHCQKKRLSDAKRRRR